MQRTDRPCGSGPGGLRSRYAALYRTRPIFLCKSRSNPNRRARARHRPTVRERHFLLRRLTTRDRRCAEKHSDPERRASRHADFACPSFLACRGLPSGLLSETRPDAILSSLCAAVLAQSHRRKWNVQNLSRYSRFLNACACGKVRQSASILFHSWAVTGVTDKRLPFCKSCMVLSSGICLKVRSAITSLNVLSHCTSTQYQIGLSGGLVRIGRFNDLHSPDNTGHRAAGTVKEGEIAQLHGFEKIAGLIAANAIPSVYAVRLLPQIINAKGLRFRFQKPVGHLKLSALSKQALE